MRQAGMKTVIRAGARRLTVAALLCGALSVAAAALGTASASAQGEGLLAPFTDCPVHNPLMVNSPAGDAMGCVDVVGGAGGSFTIGKTTVPLTHPVEVQMGYYSFFDTNGNQNLVPVTPADGGVKSSPETVPGGLLGLMCPSKNATIEKICLKLVNNTALNGVTAQVVSAGAFSSTDDALVFGPLLGVPPFTQPVKIHLRNLLLGNNCYIGSNAHPILLNPTDGTTSPPPPNQPISGVIPPFTFGPPNVVQVDPVNHPNLLLFQVFGATFVDNAFAVPAATGCGPLGLLDGAVNSKQHLPSPAGHNTVILPNTNGKIVDDFSTSPLPDADLIAAMAAGD